MTNKPNGFIYIGVTDDSEIRHQVKSMNKIENKDFKSVYKTKSGIEKLLMNNREKGFGGKTKIEIIIN